MNLTRFSHGLSLINTSTAAAGAGLSPLIWKDCDLLGMLTDPGVGTLVKDDFTKVLATAHGYELTNHNGTFTAVAGSQYGEALLATGATDNDEAHISYNNDVAGCIKCNTSQKWWYEARVKLSQVAAAGGVFVGLMEQAASANDIMADTTMALTATIDCIGFQILDAAPAAITYWRTMMQLAAKASVSATAAVPTATYVKLGMKSTPNAAGTIATVKFFVNGLPLADSTTSAATDFPLDVVLIPNFSIKTGTAAVFSLTIDWWQAAQLSRV
jgi:hypothetical protein